MGWMEMLGSSTKYSTYRAIIPDPCHRNLKMQERSEMIGPGSLKRKPGIPGKPENSSVIFIKKFMTNSHNEKVLRKFGQRDKKFLFSGVRRGAPDGEFYKFSRSPKILTIKS